MFTNSNKRNFIQLFTSYMILIFVVVIIAYPLLWTVGASFNPGNRLISTSLIPGNPALDHYKELFAGKASLQYSQWYINSIKSSLLTTSGTPMCVSLTAYAFSRLSSTVNKN